MNGEYRQKSELIGKVRVIGRTVLIGNEGFEWPVSLLLRGGTFLSGF
jgi:hypothetical protein